MPHFGTILDQEHPIYLLTTLLRKGDIPHALLFTGIDGIGRRTTGIAFAKACHCINSPLKKKKVIASYVDSQQSDGILSDMDDFPCGKCKACQRIASQKHPDIIQMEPEGSIMRIHQIRQLTESLTMKSFEDGIRVVIISDAHLMNHEAANAFLKTLEEPPEKTVLILTAPQPSSLLPTIVSRCEQIQFSPLSPKSIIRLMAEQSDVDEMAAKILANVSMGSISKALKMNSSGWLSIRDTLIGSLKILSSDPSKPLPLQTILGIAEMVSKEKERVDDFLEILITILRDIAICPFHPEKILNEDLMDDIIERSKHTAIEDMARKMTIIEQCRRNIKGNSNPRLSMELTILRMLDVITQEDKRLNSI